MTTPTPGPALPPFIAVANCPESGLESITITIIELTKMEVVKTLSCDWEKFRPATAGHLLIEHGYQLAGTAFFVPANLAGWTEVSSESCFVAPVHALDWAENG